MSVPGTQPAVQQGYQYQPLPTPSSIRLLQRLEDIDSSLPKFTLKTVDLQDAPSYHCLSYTWGNPHADGTLFREHFQAQSAKYSGRDHTIHIDGQVVHIQKNLFDAMRQIPNKPWARRVTQTYDHLNGQGVLHMAAKLDTPSTRSVLRSHLTNGANPSLCDFSGRSPAHYAAMHGNLAALEILIEFGADVTIKDESGKMPLAYAWERRDVASAQFLVSCMINSHASRLNETITRPWDYDYLFDDHIWIDALCIDQENISERNAQVSIMDQIYQRAGYVLVWLGEKDFSTALAVEVMRKMVKANEKFSRSTITPFMTVDKL